MARRFFNTSIKDLEAVFAQRCGDETILNELAEELHHRSTDRARKLRAAVEEQKAKIGGANDAKSGPKAKQRTEPDKPSSGGHRAHEPNFDSIDEEPKTGGSTTRPKEQNQGPLPLITNAPEQVLAAWMALEVLSPPPFRKPEDLAGGDRRAVASLDEVQLPWERGERSRPNYRLYYQIVLGSMKMEPAIERLIQRYGDTRPERPGAKGHAALAVVIVDKLGRLVNSPAVAVSSFGWGVMTALTRELTFLARWPEVERGIVRRIERRLLGLSEGEEEEGQRDKPLTRAALSAAYRTLLAETGISAEMADPPEFAIRTYEYFKSPTPPEPLLLNSFFLADLSFGRSLFAEGKAPANLRRYLGAVPPSLRKDLLQDRAALDEAVAPFLTNLSRWPGPGRHPLVLLQQAAVNIAFSETRSGGLLGINGPPGTGKTTLLRDIVAGVVTARAEAMCKYADPQDAFSHSGEKLKAGDGWLHLYRVDPSLRGFEMVVASSNNKAVENVSAELPAIGSIAADAEDLRYFKPLADALHQRETWGLIAAVMGNAANRGRFRQAFWWDEDWGMSAYLAAAAGSARQVEEKNPVTGLTEYRLPRIVVQEKPPSNHEEAVERWKRAKKSFMTAAEQSRTWQTWLESLRGDSARLTSLAAEEESAARAHDDAITQERFAINARQQAQQAHTEAIASLHSPEAKLASHIAEPPGFWARLFRTAKARAWRERRATLVGALARAKVTLRELEQVAGAMAEAARIAGEAKRQAKDRWQAAVASRTHIEQRLREAEQKFGVVLGDTDFFNQEHARKHQSVPWFPAQAQRIRDDVLIAAIKLHRAFIDASAKPLRHNLGALMNALSGQTLPGAAKESLLPDLWATLFLVVPVVSTTFASVNRMLGRLPAESLGWLLIDEAGQALPQAAVGAIIRSRRAIVVGDPVQIEPVVLLPETLTHAISRRFGVDPDLYAAPAASAQTLADAASAFASEFQTKSGSRTVGVPLLVHRRCEDPMFAVSNAIAYAGLMVQAKAAKPSAIRDVLGASAWIHVEGSGEDKWCPQEGAEVIRLLRTLSQARVAPDLYIVTPFVIVAERLRQMVRECGVLNGWIEGIDERRWTTERIGTVHTVQGREAEAVIFVLGAPMPVQTGARGWAGGRPNLLNVAVTRAKEVLYVIGNRNLWSEAGLFRDLHHRLPA